MNWVTLDGAPRFMNEKNETDKFASSQFVFHFRSLTKNEIKEIENKDYK
jgi:hypothetical protein